MARTAHACTHSLLLPPPAQPRRHYRDTQVPLLRQLFQVGKVSVSCATRSLLMVALLCPSLPLHNSLMQKTSRPTRKHAPVQAHLIWIKDVFGFSLFHKARENLHYPELGGRSMCVFFTRLSLGLFHITSLQSRSGCRFVLLSSEIQNSCPEFPLFLNSQGPLTATR